MNDVSIREPLTFAPNLLKFRLDRNMTRQQIKEVLAKGNPDHKITISLIQKLETKLQRVADHQLNFYLNAFDITLLELLDIDGIPLFLGDELTRQETPDNSELEIFRVNFNILDEISIEKNTFVHVDTSETAINSLESGKAVIAHPGNDKNLLIIRQFIAPAMLIANSQDTKLQTINTRRNPFKIYGVVKRYTKDL